MKKIIRLLLALTLAAAMLLQCFAAGAVSLEDPAPADPPAETAEPAADSAAPVIRQARLRPAASEDDAALLPEQTIYYASAVCFFQLEDPAGEDGAEPSGVGLARSSLTVDGRTVERVSPEPSDQSLTASFTLPDGRHEITLTARDLAGNETVQTWVLTVRAGDLIYPVYTLVPGGDYAPLGGKVTLTLHTSNAAQLSALHAALALPAAFAEQCTVSAGQGFSLDGEPVYTDGVLSFCVRANLALTGERDAAILTFDIPRDTPAGTSLTYAVAHAWAETRHNSPEDYLEGFTLPEQTLPVKAPYVVRADEVYLHMSETPYFHVSDASGNPAGRVNVLTASGDLVGRTDWKGLLEIPGAYYAEAGSFTVYAQGESGVSYPLTVTVGEPVYDVETPLTYRAQSNPDGTKTVCWLSPLHDTVYLRYAETSAGLSSAQSVPVSHSRVSFSGVTAQVNTQTITGLTPGKNYLIQTSYDGVSWSAVRGFSPAYLEKGTRFAVLGDARGAGAEQLSALAGHLGAMDLPLLIQTGDLVPDGGDASAWTQRLSALSALGSTELLLAPGDRELASDSGRAAAALAAQPEGPYSMEYGDVYLAVIPYRADQDYQADLEWLVRDAAKTTCGWKVLVTHQPVYTTASDTPDGMETLFPRYVEQAGISFVLSGHDQTYARTPALKNGVPAESYDGDLRTGLRGDGAVYLICGAVGETDRPVASSQPFEQTVITDTNAVYLTAEVTSERFTIRAYDLSGEEVRELDSVTMYASSCVTEGHVFSETSHYDHAGKTLICDRCGEAIPAAESRYTGFVAMDTGRAYLDRGAARTGWFLAMGTYYHAGTDARVHVTEDYSTATCTEEGQRMAWCAECRESRAYGSALPATGHHYDSAHHCTNYHYDENHRIAYCGWTGLDLSALTGTLSYLYGYYTGAPLEPAVTVTDASGAAVPASEYTVEYENNTDIGMAAVRLTGQNNYYGELTIPFEIRPGDVTSLEAEDVDTSSLTLVWPAAAGAQRYAVYQNTDSGWKRLGDTADTRFAVTGLNPGTSYTFRVRAYTAVAKDVQRLDGSKDRTFWSSHSSPERTVSTRGTAFRDVPESEWFAGPVAWAVANGVTQGTGDGLFSPWSHCTRGQMVTFLWRAKGSPAPRTQTSPFEDVKDPQAYYYYAVLWAVEEGITRGSSTTTFSPDAPVTRGMVVTFLHRAAGDPEPAGNRMPFVDVEGWQYYARSVQWAVERKITAGVDSTHFEPDRICNRAEIVTFLYRFMTR